MNSGVFVSSGHSCFSFSLKWELMYLIKNVNIFFVIITWSSSECRRHISLHVETVRLILLKQIYCTALVERKSDQKTLKYQRRPDEPALNWCWEETTLAKTTGRMRLKRKLKRNIKNLLTTPTHAAGDRKRRKHDWRIRVVLASGNSSWNYLKKFITRRKI